MHIVQLGPQEGFEEVVQALGGAFEGGRHRTVAVDHQDLGFVKFPLDGKIPEGVPDKFRLEPPILAVADENILHDLGPARGADVVRAGGGEIQIAPGRQIFREAQEDPAALGGMGPQANQAADVLSGIVNAAAQGYGVEDLRADVPGTQPGTQDRFGVRQQLHGRGCLPGCGGVDDLADEELAVGDLTGSADLAAVGIQRDGTIGGQELQGVDGFQNLTIAGGTLGHALGLAVEAVSQLDGQAVFPLPEQVRDVKFAVVDAVGGAVGEGVEKF